jgi:hypothetical protein
MALVNAVITDKAREVAPKMYGGILPFAPASYFRVGEGGWIDPGGGRIRRDPPDRTFTDLDLILDLGRAGPQKRYNVAENFGYFQKALTPLDFVFEGPSTLRIRCFLDFGEYNIKNAPGATLVYDVGGPYASPEIWELGIYDTSNNLLAYGTFPKQTKDGTKQIENVVRMVW